METGIVTGAQPPVASRLRISGALLILGLLVELLTLFWNHPLSFVSFIGIGGLLMGAGIVIFLWTLVSTTKTTE